MSVIIISRGAHHKGEEIAEKTAQKLGYSCVSRDILLEASQKYNVPEIKLKKSISRNFQSMMRLISFAGALNLKSSRPPRNLSKQWKIWR